MNAYSEDPRRKTVEALRRGAGKSETARAFGVGPSCVKRHAKLDDAGRPLAPKKRPASSPKIDGDARRLLETDLQQRPTATLGDGRGFLGRVARVWVSTATPSRMLERTGLGREKGRRERTSATSS